MISFLGFNVNLDDILEKVEKWFGKQLSGDHLQQEFYQLAQDKPEKVRQFTGRLEQKYKYLKEKFPNKYQTKDLKDRLFHGMHPHICKSMRFFYKKAEVTYEELLSETLEVRKIVVPPNLHLSSPRLPGPLNFQQLSQLSTW